MFKKAIRGIRVSAAVVLFVFGAMIFTVSVILSVIGERTMSISVDIAPGD